MTVEALRIGTAGWNVPFAHAARVPAEGSHLERYAAALNCVEINSTFYRPHRASTFARWAAVTPVGFRFAVKAPKAITHTKKLVGCGGELVAFFASLQPLGEKLGPVLLQLPPKLAFDEGTAFEFFTTLREVHRGAVVLEPRHFSWFVPPVEQMLRGFAVARAAADPAKGAPAASTPGGWAGLRYWRLHGSPRTYWSAYNEESLQELARAVRAERAEIWIVFDNTAQGHAFPNALELKALTARAD